MKKLKNKRAFGAVGYILPIAILAGIATFLFYSGSEAMAYDYVGQSSLQVKDASKKAESAMEWIKMSASYSIQQAIYELGKKGGFKETGRCGRHSGFNVWAEISTEGGETEVEECYPTYDELKANLISFFDEDVNEYFGIYPSAYIPGEYSYNLDGNIEITAAAEENQKIAVPIGEGLFDKTPSFPSTASAPADALYVAARGRIDIETIRQYHPEVLQKYEELCRRMGAEPYPQNPGPCYITSGYRHPAYNREVGGARNSQHQLGLALDIQVGRDVQAQLRWAQAASEIGFTGIGVYPRDAHIHIDLRQGQEIYYIGSGGRTLASFQNFEELNDRLT